MNQNEMLLLKLGEVVLKGLNRRSFEDKLVSNVRRRMKPCGSFQIYIRQSTIYVEPQTETCDMEAAYKAACQIFGVVTVARAVPCDKTMDAIVETAKAYLADEFARARDLQGGEPPGGQAVPHELHPDLPVCGRRAGASFSNVKADMHHPDLTVYVEIREKHAYVHAPSVPGAGGLPIGMGGRAVSLLSGGLDSPVSSYMIARRGVELEMVHFVSPPYTSQQAQDKVLELARLLTVYCGRMIVHIIPFTEIQEEIRRQCPEEYFTLIMRRFMMRLAEAVARKSHASALVTGESLGQVASQTMQGAGRHGGRDEAARPAAPDRHWTRWRSSAWPGRSAPTKPPSCPMRTAAPCLPPATPPPGRCWRTCVKAESVLDIDGPGGQGAGRARPGCG